MITVFTCHESLGSIREDENREFRVVSADAAFSTNSRSRFPFPFPVPVSRNISPKLRTVARAQYMQ